MDDFDYHDPTKPTRSFSSILVNVLTVMALLAALCLGSSFAVIFFNPQSGLNPFPPPTLPAALEFPTATPTPRGVLPPTWTPLPTREPTLTFTPRPTATAEPTETPFSLFTPSPIPRSTKTPGGMAFVPAPNSPVYLASAAFHPDNGCNWLGVAGQVINANGAPVSTGIIIQLRGALNGTTKDIPSLTGVAPQYGQSGYEIFLSEKPMVSQKTLYVQLLDQAGLPLSNKVYFDTYESCEKNLVFINFKQAR